jgi:hypothetical protein
MVLSQDVISLTNADQIADDCCNVQDVIYLTNADQIADDCCNVQD